MAHNKYGLQRDIPEPVKRAVRAACGFGCVICGLPFYHYDHFDPEFENARTHDAAGIALLCGYHHDKRTRGTLSKETVASACGAPNAVTHGVSRDLMDVGSNYLVHFGGITFNGVHTLIATADGERWLVLDPPEKPGSRCGNN
jgi:hypothetical protein